MAVAAVVAGGIVYTVMDRPKQPSFELSPAPVEQTEAPPSVNHLEQARSQMKREAYADALATIAAMPDSSQIMEAQLLKAVILARSGERRQAESLLLQLTERYPQRPEPLNNLAVLYAQDGDSARAIDTLQLAFSTHASYARIYQNLSDLYAGLAADAYNKALGLAGNNQGPQLALLDRFSEPEEPNAALVISRAPAPQAPAVAAPEEPVEPPETQPDTAVVAEADATAPTAESQQDSAAFTSVVVAPEDSAAINNAQQPAGESSASTPADEAAELLRATPEEQAIQRDTRQAEALLARIGNETEESDARETPAKAEPVPAPKVAPETLVRQQINKWAQAWSAQSVEDYVRAYVAGYQPDAGTTHTQWVRQRTSRLTRPSFIKVTLSDIKVKLISDIQAEATFRQEYRSDNYRDSEQKRLKLVLRANGWKIASEERL